MFEIREFPMSEGHIQQIMTEIDGIPAPASLVDEAQGLANKNKKVWFIGVEERRNPNFKEVNPDTLPPWTGIIEGSRLMNMRSGNRFELTGRWIISDDRDAILAHGCGRLMWITPQHSKTVHERLTMVHDVLTADSSGYTAHSLMNECATIMIVVSNLMVALPEAQKMANLANALALKAREIERVILEVQR